MLIERPSGSTSHSRPKKSVMAGSSARRDQAHRADDLEILRQRLGGVGQHVGARLERAVVERSGGRREQRPAERGRRVGRIVTVAIRLHPLRAG
jgi:hypothetical protein